MVLCNDLEGWDREGGREAEEGGDMGIYVYIWLIHFVVQQKLTQYCEAVIRQKRSIKKTHIPTLKDIKGCVIIQSLFLLSSFIYSPLGI